MAFNGTLYVTFIEKDGSYIKIWGQTERNVPVGIENSLSAMKQLFDAGQQIPAVQEIQLDKVLCAKFKDGNYYRTKVTNVNYLHQGIVEVQFIDYGNKEFIHCSYCRLLLNEAIANVAPQAQEFILGNVTHNGPCWEEAYFQMICNQLRYIEFPYTILYKIGNVSVVRLFKNGKEDVAGALVSSGLAISVAQDMQQVKLCTVKSPVYTTPTTSPQTSPPKLSSPSTPTILTFKASPIEPGTDHLCYVSYISDGPGLFSIQLQKQEEALKKMMSDLNTMNLQYLEEVPYPGTVCLARAIDDDYICRAVITNMVDMKFKVFYVDFGNTEELPLERLYQIPFKYVIPKVMAIRFALAGLENMAVSIEMKCAFKNFVNNKLLHMRVIPTKNRTPLPLCELWNDEGIHVLDVLKSVALDSYPECLPLARGNVDVKICYVQSCNKFFVNLKSKEQDLKQLMDDIQIKSSRLMRFQRENVKSGCACIALYTDGQWYRAQVVSSQGNDVTVKYVDYGNEDVVPLSNLRVPDFDDIIKLRPQAVECALNGYQNMEPQLDRDAYLEDLIIDNEFVMKVCEVQDTRAIVDLIDSHNNNVASLLFAKIKASQMTSPVQENKPDFRKKSLTRQDSNLRTSDNDRDWRGSSESPRQNRYNNRDSNESDTKHSRKNDNWRRRNDEDTHSNKSFSDKEKSPDSYKYQKNFRSPNEERGQGDRWNNYEERGRRERSFQNEDRGKREKSFHREDQGQNDRNTYSNNFTPKGEKKYHEKPGGFRNQDQSNRSAEKTKMFRQNSKGYSPRERNFSCSSETKSPVSTSTFETVFDAADLDAQFIWEDMVGLSEKVKICWFHNPSMFFIQRANSEDAFKSMMTEIQTTYAQAKILTSATQGMAVIALFPEDKVLYRAVVLEVLNGEYLVTFIDFGNKAKVNKIWPLDKKYLQLPAQAICCGLSGITPVGDCWQGAEAYGTLFDKELFDAVFSTIPYNSNTYSVELFHNEMDIAKELVNRGLANEIAIAEPLDIDFSILIGQQFRVTLISYKSSSDILVQLDIGCQLNCSSSLLNGQENGLSQYLGKQLIIIVNNVGDKNRVEVSFYDPTGRKLFNDFDKTEIDILCPMPVYNKSMTGYIAHTEATEIYFTPHSMSHYLSLLLERLYNTYDSNTSPSITPELNKVYAVKSADGQWYRGKIKNINGGDIEVQYLDYGNKENVTIDMLKELEDVFKELPVLALPVITNKSYEHLVECDVSIEIKRENNNWLLVSAINSDDQEGSNVEKANVKEVEQPVVEADIQINSKTFELIGERVVLSHTDSPSDFYLQHYAALDDIDSLQKVLQEQADNLTNLENPVAGVLCAASYSLNQQWYRAQVLDADEDITTVRFIDYGNTDVISSTGPAIKTLPSELLTLEHHSRRCSLMYKCAEKEWTPAACELFEELAYKEDSVLTAEIVYQDEKLTYVELYVGGLNIGEELMKKGLAIKLKLDTDSTCMGYISHINSPSEFWIQLEHAVGDLEWTAEQLGSAENYPELQDVTPGSLCAAIYNDDELWYRARILSNTVAGLEVLFIDYGNSYTCNSVRELPEDLVMLPPLAVKCSLKKPEGLLQWPSFATEKFKEISEDGAAEFVVKKISPGETAIVQLTHQGKDIAEQLKPQLLDAKISSFESVDNFWIQKCEDLNKINEMKNTTNEDITAVENDLVAVLLNDNWYRAKVLSLNNDNEEKEKSGKYKVLLIDYGRIEYVDSVKSIDEALKTEHGYAVQCKLESLPGHKWSDDVNKKLNAIHNEGSTIFQIEIVTENIIRLYLNGRDIRSDLGCIKCSPLESLQSTPIKTVIKNPSTDIEASNESNEISTSKAEETLTVEIANEQSKSNDDQSNIESEEIQPQVETQKQENLNLKEELVTETEKVEIQEIVKETENTKEIQPEDETQEIVKVRDNAKEIQPEVETQEIVKETENAKEIQPEVETQEIVKETENAKEIQLEVESKEVVAENGKEQINNSINTEESEPVKTISTQEAPILPLENGNVEEAATTINESEAEPSTNETSLPELEVKSEE